MSIIRRYPHDGGIVKKTLSRDGEKAEALFYLPQSTNIDNFSVTLLNPPGDDDWISMVVNKSQQGTYDFAKCEKLGIPDVVMRERSSIAPYKTSLVRRIPYRTVSVNKPQVDGTILCSGLPSLCRGGPVSRNTRPIVRSTHYATLGAVPSL
jgi:hypothetical protein